MAANTDFLGSDLTTRFTGSDVSLDRQLFVRSATQLGGALNSASAISGGALTVTTVAGTTGNFTSTVSIRGATTLFSTLGSASAVSTGNARVLNLGIGNSSTSLVFVSGSSTTIVATTVTATMSVTTTGTDNVVQLGDIIMVGPSNLSNGVVLQAFASGNSTVTFQYSNCSTVNAAQVAINCRYVVLRSNG